MSPDDNGPVLQSPFLELANSVSDAVVGVSDDGVVHLYNAAAEHLFGRPAREVLGGSLALLLPHLPEQIKKATDFAIPGAARADTAADVVELVRADGTSFMAELRMFDSTSGSVRSRTIVLREKEDRRRGEAGLELLRRMALSIGSAEDLETALTDVLAQIGDTTGWMAGESWLPAAGEVLVRGSVWSSAGAALEKFHAAGEDLSFDPGQGLPGRAWSSRAPAWISSVQDDPNFIRAGAAARANLHTGFAIPVLKGNEVVAVIAFYHSEQRSEDPQLVELVASVAAQLGSLVRRKQAENDLARYAEELSRSNAELERYAHAASHDLQEPLRMVASYVQLLERRYAERLDTEAREIIGYAVEGVTRMRQQILDLLALAEVKRSAEALPPAHAERVLRRKVAELSPLVQASGAELTWDDLPEVAMDPRQLGQVFECLLSNALKFRGEGPPRVHLSAARDESGWVFSVRDNGIGIAAEYHERIFTMFQRLNPRERYPGTGMGLPIVRKIVELHGGRAWVESTPGDGSTFLFSVPSPEE